MLEVNLVIFSVRTLLANLRINALMLLLHILEDYIGYAAEKIIENKNTLT